MVHETRHFSDGGLFVQSLLWIIFDRKTWYYWQNLIGYNNFLLYNKQKLLGLYIFLKIASIVKKVSSESDHYRVSVQRSRTISGLSVVN